MLEVNSDNKEMKLTFLHAYGPSNSFNYPEPQNTVNWIRCKIFEDEFLLQIILANGHLVIIDYNGTIIFHVCNLNFEVARKSATTAKLKISQNTVSIIYQ